MSLTSFCPLREWKAVIHFIYLCKMELLYKRAPQTGPGVGREASPTTQGVILWFPSTHTYQSHLTSPCSAPLTAVPKAHHTTRLPTATPLLTLGPPPGRPSHHPNSHRRLTNGPRAKLILTPPRRPHCLRPLCSHHLAELGRYDHRPLCTVITRFRGCLAHQAERFPGWRLLIHSAISEEPQCLWPRTGRWGHRILQAPSLLEESLCTKEVSICVSVRKAG